MIHIYPSSPIPRRGNEKMCASPKNSKLPQDKNIFLFINHLTFSPTITIPFTYVPITMK